jgi:hypothetical protein
MSFFFLRIILFVILSLAWGPAGGKLSEVMIHNMCVTTLLLLLLSQSTVFFIGLESTMQMPRDSKRGTER